MREERKVLWRKTLPAETARQIKLDICILFKAMRETEIEIDR